MSGLKYTNKLANKRVLVIGGTSGIGFCVAENCVEHGALVTVASSQQSSVDKAIARLRTSYPQFSNNIQGHVVDLKSADAEANVKKLFDFASDNGKHKIDHVADTAGDTLNLKPLSEFSAENMAMGQRVRWLGTIYIAKLAKTYMNPAPTSSLTLTGGVNTMRPGNNWFLAAGTGAAKEGLTRGLAVDMRPIRVNLVAPGAVNTELFGKFFSDDAEGKARLQGMIEGFKKETLIGEIGTPEDVCEAYVYCMKDRFVDGQAIYTEGGLLLAPGAQR